MKLHSCAFALALLAGGYVNQAAAGPVILDFHVDATNFKQLFGTGATAPFGEISGDFHIAFDNSSSFSAILAGLTVDGLNFAGPTYMAYDATKDLLTVGSDPFLGGYHYNAGQYGFYVDHASTNFSSSGLNYQFGGTLWKSTNVTLTPLAAAVPEPAAWMVMLGGFGMIGGALRSRRKAAVRVIA